MKYFLICMSMLILCSCSGSLTDSGIFWSKKQALAEQEILKEDLKRTQDESYTREMNYYEKEEYTKQLRQEANRLNKEIAEVEAEIYRLQRGGGKHTDNIKALNKKRSSLHKELKEYEHALEVVEGLSR